MSDSFAISGATTTTSPGECLSISSLERICGLSVPHYPPLLVDNRSGGGCSIVTLWGRAVKHYSFTEQLQANVAWVDKYALQSSPTSSTTPLTGHTNHCSPSQYIKNFSIFISIFQLKNFSILSVVEVRWAGLSVAARYNLTPGERVLSGEEIWGGEEGGGALVSCPLQSTVLRNIEDKFKSTLTAVKLIYEHKSLLITRDILNLTCFLIIELILWKSSFVCQFYTQVNTWLISCNLLLSLLKTRCIFNNWYRIRV